MGEEEIRMLVDAGSEKGTIDHTVAGQQEIEAIPQRIFMRNLNEEMLGQ